MPSSKVLVLGPSEFETRSFLNGLTGVDGSNSLSLSTKYYSASLTFVVGPPFSSSPIDMTEAGPHGLIEAVILVVGIARDFTEDALLEPLTHWSEACEAGGVGTLLLALTGCDYLTATSAPAASGSGGAGAMPTPPSLPLAQAWSLDHGFECVEVATSKGASFGGETRDKVSYPRVIEALEATIWSTAIMSKGGSKASSSSSTSISIKGDEAGDGVEDGQARGAPYAPPSLVSPEEDAAATASAVDSLLPSQGELFGSLALGGGGGGGGGAGEVDQMAQFEVLLQQAMSVRAAAKAGTVSDAARRAAAESMLEKLMGLFGGMEEGEEGEEGDEQGGEGGEKSVAKEKGGEDK